MSKSTAVEERASSVPALVQNSPALDIDSGDITLPRIRIGHGQSAAVGDGLAKAGDIYSTQGADDPNPTIHYEAGSDSEGVLVHVLGLRKGKSSTDADGELVTWAFNDPDAPADARVTYDYSVVLPEVDEDVPYKFMLKGSSTSAAKLINTVLKKNEGRGPAYAIAFRITTRERSTTKGSKTFKYHVAVVRQVEAKPEHVAIAEQLAAIVAGNQVEASAPAAAAPAI